MVQALAKKQKSVEYPTRPGYGTQGRQVQLFANYFELKSAGKGLFRYHVDIDGGSGRQVGPRKAKQIISLLLEDNFGESLRPSIATDYRSTIISHQKILDQDQEPVTFDIIYRNEKEDEPATRPERYRVTCQFTGHLDRADLLNYLTSTNAGAMFQEKADILQALNIVFGHYPKSSEAIASQGANKHYAIDDGAEKFRLDAGLEALRGYFISVRAATARVLVNVQVKYVACYQDGPLEQVIRSFQRENRSGNAGLKKFLDKIRVRVTHIRRKNKKGEDIPRIKTIINVATPQDGRSLPKPPIVSRYGAGPKDVQFFLDSPGQSSQQGSSAASKGKKAKKPAGPEPSGAYITVADFFASSKLPIFQPLWEQI